MIQRLIQLSLRGKTTVTLVALAVSTLLLASMLGGVSYRNIRDELGQSYIASHVKLNQQRLRQLLAPEIALSQRFAESEFLRRWLLAENDTHAREQFFAEAAGYQRSFADHNYFVASAASGHFYFNDPHSATSQQARYTLQSDKVEDRWFYSTINQVEAYNINVDTDRTLKTTKIWFNVPVYSGTGQAIGVAGSGIDLTGFLTQFIARAPANTQAMLIDQRGAIQAHPNPEMIDYSSVGKPIAEHTLHQLLDTDTERAELTLAMSRLRNGQENLLIIAATVSNTPRLIALSYLPELRWFVVSTLDLNAYHLFDKRTIFKTALIVALVVLLLLALSLSGFDRIVLRPLTRLTRSVREVAAGAYDVRIESSRTDELGELARTFNQMAQHVLEYTTHLEERVDQRTQALREAHARIDTAHRILTESIECASLFQRALLPSPQTLARFPGEFQALWLPRDVVGGDLYLMRQTPEGFLIVLIDCAGHGVPGALMTMIAHAALDVALSKQASSDPAALLGHFDSILRAMLPARQRFGQITTDMDVALCHIDNEHALLRYAGARIPLRWVDAGGYGQFPAGRRSICGAKPPQLENHCLPLTPGQTFYLASDGFLDQNGGEQGFGFGESAFRSLMTQIAPLPLTEQPAAFHRALGQYRSSLPQRDDVSVLAFRINAFGIHDCTTIAA